MNYLLTDTQVALQKMAQEYATNVMRSRSLEVNKSEFSPIHFEYNGYRCFSFW